MTGRHLLDVRGLTVAFPGSRAVEDATFHVDEGETLALVGESGCGKSLTAFSIMRLLPPRATIVSGRILFEGEDILLAPPPVLRGMRGKKISLILQEPMTSLNPVLTIGYQVQEVIRQHEPLSRRQARARAIELLDLVRIPEPARRYEDFPFALSGGMRQRVMIAMAIACGPRLLIADEPTTALDVTIQAQVLELLDGLRRQMAMAVLLITHDLGVVAQWADRVAVMYAGRIVERAPAEVFRAAPRHPYSIGLRGSSINHRDGWHYTSTPLREIPGNIGSARDEPGCRFAPRCPDVVAACLAAQPPLEALRPGHDVACPVAVAREIRQGADAVG